MEIKKNSYWIIILISVFVLSGCFSTDPDPIVINKDMCAHCKMGISDLKFSSELVTQKGRIYKFDDIKCLSDYTKDNQLTDYQMYFTDFANNNNLLHQDKAVLIRNNTLNGPMGGQIVAFSSVEAANKVITTGENHQIQIQDLGK